MGVDAFFVERGGQFDGTQRQLCDSCPVRQECLEVALADVSFLGLWGGTTPVERRRCGEGRWRELTSRVPFSCPLGPGKGHDPTDSNPLTCLFAVRAVVGCS